MMRRSSNVITSITDNHERADNAGAIHHRPVWYWGIMGNTGAGSNNSNGGRTTNHAAILAWALGLDTGGFVINLMVPS